MHFIKLFLLLTASTLASAPVSRPKSVTIIDVPRERRDYGYHIGNIKVRFTDGHSEIWTAGGKCMLAHVSATGLVGWTRYTERNAYQEPVNDPLRIRYLNGNAKDFEASGSGPFIGEWGFADNDAAVVIQSRGRHGPAYFVKYSLRTGKLLGSVDVSAPYEQLSQWAQPYADDRPGR